MWREMKDKNETLKKSKCNAMDGIYDIWDVQHDVQ